MKCASGCQCGRHKHGPEHQSWKGDEASYSGNHMRVDRVRGKARDHDCVSCVELGIPKKADEWAQVHGESGSDPWADFVPLCYKCHKRYDNVGSKGGNAKRAGGRNTGMRCSSECTCGHNSKKVSEAV